MADRLDHPVKREWSLNAGMEAQNDSANKWFKQSNEILARRAESGVEQDAPTESSQMAAAPQSTTNASGMSAELDPAELDMEMEQEATGLQQSEGELDYGDDATPEEKAELLALAEEAREIEAIEREQEMENEEGYDYE